MAFGDIISSLVFESQDSELNLSDRDSSDGDSSSDEEESRGIMGSFFGFIGLGRRRNRNIKPILPKKSNNNNVYDYKPGYMRENPHNSSGKNFQVVRIKTLKHNGVEVDKTKEVKMFEIDSNPVLRKPEHSPKEYDLDSSITESEISWEGTVKKNGLKLKLKMPTKENLIDEKLPKPSGQSILRSRLFVKTLENIFSKKISSYSSHFLSQLKLEHASMSGNKSRRTESFSNALRSSFKSPQRVKTLNTRKNTLENTVGWSTRGSTIFGKKELNMIYQNNSLESLPEGESIWSEKSPMKSSKQILEIKEGLEKLQNTMRKNDNLKIQAFYKLMSYQWETPSELITININDREIPEGHEKLDKSPKPPLTARRRHRGRNDKKSFALKFKEINCQEELKQSTKREKDHNGLKSELSKEDNELDLQSESDYAIQTFRCSTKSELGNFEEEEQIYLVSDYDDSIDLDNHEKSPFYFNSTQPAMLQNIDISSVGDIKDENNSSMNSHGFSEDFENEKKFCKKISMNKKDIFRMTKQVEEIRKMFNTDS